MTTLDTYDNYATPVDGTPGAAPAPARSAREQRFKAALVCLGAAYAFSWAELALTAAVGFPGDASSHPLTASIASRVLVGLLYLCVASRLQWARWVALTLGFVSVALVAPMLALQWHTFAAGAVVCGAGLVCKLAASLYLLSPMPARA